MRSKINVSDIVVGHFKTLKNADGSNSVLDHLLFFGFPFSMALVAIIMSYDASKDVVALLVNFGAIFTALLLSVLVLVYDQENKYEDRKTKSGAQSDDPLLALKKRLLDELYFNISFSILASVVLVILCLFHAIIGNFSFSLELFENTISIEIAEKILTPLIIVFVTSIFLNIFMVVKRLHALLTTRGIV